MVSVLYHEAKTRKIPMTKLTDQLLRQCLIDSPGWRTAESSQQQQEQEQNKPALMPAQAA
jgi:hypothetical protein